MNTACAELRASAETNTPIASDASTKGSVTTNSASTLPRGQMPNTMPDAPTAISMDRPRTIHSFDMEAPLAATCGAAPKEQRSFHAPSPRCAARRRRGSDGAVQKRCAARDAGVKRFIPPDYSLDLFKVKPGHIPTSDMRRHFAFIADTERARVEVVHVLNGGFLDRSVLFGFIRVIDVEKQTAYVWGDGKQPMDWTTYADTA